MSSYVTDNNGSERIGIITYDEDGNFANTLGATFDGTNDFLLRGSDLTGNADGTVGMAAFRIRFNGSDGVIQYLYNTATAYCAIFKLGINRIRIILKDSVGTELINLTANGVIVADGDYHNVLISWDTSADANNHFYQDDVDELGINTRISGTIDYTRAEHSIGATTVGSTKVNADINFFYFNSAETMDFSIEANRRKFFDSNGKPVLSPNGSGSEATGSAPIIYQAGNFAKWHDNKGTGGGFAVTGALTSPST